MAFLVSLLASGRASIHCTGWVSGRNLASSYCRDQEITSTGRGWRAVEVETALMGLLYPGVGVLSWLQRDVQQTTRAVGVSWSWDRPRGEHQPGLCDIPDLWAHTCCNESRWRPGQGWLLFWGGNKQERRPRPLLFLFDPIRTTKEPDYFVRVYLKV